MTEQVHRWALISVKPGVGKSTSAVFLGQALHEEGHDPLVVDADRGQTCVRWDEMAGGLPYPVVGKPSRGLDRTLPDLERGRRAVLVDVPQIEDHAAIARGAMVYGDRWIMPLAPSVVEVDRMFADADDRKSGGGLKGLMEDAQDLRERAGRAPADVVVILTRTNRRQPTKGGPDADVRAEMTEQGYHVLQTQIPHHDLYRQAGGTRVRAIGTPYQTAMRELLARPYGGR
jgi:chromosome partitioning protein